MVQVHLGPFSVNFNKYYGGLAQLGEHLLCKQEVIGSIPLTSIDRDVKLVP